MFENEADLRQFLLVGRRGSVAEACEALGMSKASYYRKINWVVERAMSAERHDDNLQKAADEQAAIEFRTQLRALVLRHPTWGYERFARGLGYRLGQISANTVANLLRELRLDSRRARIENLIEAVVNGQLAELTKEQAEAIAEVNPLVNDRLLFRAEDELVLGTALVPVFELLGPHWYLQLFVELRSLFTFGRFIRKTQDSRTNLCTGRDNESDLELLQSMTGKRGYRVYWSSRCWGQADLSAYRPLSPVTGSLRYCTIVRKPPAGLAMMRNRIRTEWLSSRSPANGPNDEALRNSLSGWFDAHNLSPTEEVFPTAGRSPADVLGLGRDQARTYLARSLSDENRGRLPWEERIPGAVCT